MSQVATTADGTPCQLCRERDGYCHHHDGDPKTTGGRPHAITGADHDEILAAARDGVSKQSCAKRVGASLKTLNRYLDRNDQFRVAFRRARAEGALTLIHNGLRGEANSSMVRFLLATSFGYVRDGG
jgi:hypothetical protein